MKISEDQASAFWSKVSVADNSKDCWEWAGARKPKGYGNVRLNNKYLLAHRVAFELANAIIPDGLMVCHICDNPPCCNPNHLMLGTAKSNAADRIIKGRVTNTRHTAARGAINGNSKLTIEAVKEIRRSTLTRGSLAEQFGVSKVNIGIILRNETWRHV